MRDVTVSVPDDRVGELYEAVAALNEPSEEPAPSRPSTRWDRELATNAVDSMRDHEKMLLWRIADARGQRVPVSQLARDLGLPEATAPEQDFSRLTAFCAEPTHPRMPVVTGGADADGWYWMSTDDARVFRFALTEAFRGTP